MIFIHKLFNLSKTIMHYSNTKNKSQSKLTVTRIEFDLNFFLKFYFYPNLKFGKIAFTLFLSVLILANKINAKNLSDEVFDHAFKNESVGESINEPKELPSNLILSPTTIISNASFKAAITSVCPACILPDGTLTAYAKTITSLDISFVSNSVFPKIDDISGVDGFTSLTVLEFSGNSLTFIPSSLPVNVQKLTFRNNVQLVNFPNLSSYTKLTEVYASNTAISIINNLPPNLNRLDCNNNNSLYSIASVPLSLQYLVCDHCPLLTSLPVLPYVTFSPYSVIMLDESNFFPQTASKLSFSNGTNTCPVGLIVRGNVSDITSLVCNQVTPLNWLEFKTNVIGSNDRKVKLNWLTVSEVNVKNFSVERSNNGSNYLSISNPIEANNTLSQNSYEFIDEQPISGVSYYRILEKDFDGAKGYSSVRSINIMAGANDFSIAPNPASYQVSFDLKSFEGKETQILITDLAGKILKEEVVREASSEPYLLNLPDIQNGLYLIKLQIQGIETFPKKLQILR